MRRLVYSMMISLDGYIAGPGGEIDWHVVDEPLHRHFNDRERQADTHLYGRRMYETMVPFWPDARSDASLPDFMREYARIWERQEKIVVSRTLAEARYASRIIRGDVVEEVRALKARPGKKIFTGGSGLASTLMDAGLLDEVNVVVNPVVLGGGIPLFREGTKRHRLRLVGTRPFESGVVEACYEVVHG